MSSSNFETLLDECLARLYAGERLERILQDHPENANRLRPLLEVAGRMFPLPTPHARPSAIRQGRQRMLDAVEAKVQAPQPALGQMFRDAYSSFFSSLRPAFGNVIALIMLAGLVLFLTWILASLDFRSDPARQQTPTLTSTPTFIPTVSNPTLTGTAPFTPTRTPTQTRTPTPTFSPSPVFITRTPTPTPTKKKDDEEPPESTPIPPYPPPFTNTPIPPYPAPETETPTPTNTETETPLPTETEFGPTLPPTATGETPTLIPTP